MALVHGLLSEPSNHLDDVLHDLWHWHTTICSPKNKKKPNTKTSVICGTGTPRSPSRARNGLQRQGRQQPCRRTARPPTNCNCGTSTVSDTTTNTGTSTTAGAWVTLPNKSSGQQLARECRPSSDSSRCTCRPLGPPATVTPGRLLASPSGANLTVSPPRAQTALPSPPCGSVIAMQRHVDHWGSRKGKRAERAVTLESERLLLLLFSTRAFNNAFMSTSSEDQLCKGALDNEELFVIECCVLCVVCCVLCVVCCVLCWLLVVGCWLLVVGCWLLVVGCWLLVVGCWLLVVGCWLLVVGCWLLVVGCCCCCCF